MKFYIHLSEYLSKNIAFYFIFFGFDLESVEAMALLVDA